jgi:membrane protease YdiL (CAAX protease family)
MQTTNIMVYAISYAMVFVLSWISKINKNSRLFNDEGGITQKPGNLLGIHLAVILWLCLVPVILLNLPVIHVLFGNSTPEASSIFSFGLLCLAAITIAIRLGNDIMVPGIVSHDMPGQLTRSFFKKYFIIRALYLFAYELWFRGFLLFETIRFFGIPAAVSLNILLYTLLHIFKSKKEMLSCIPFGFILCFLSIFFNAAWPAIILHISFSLIYELNIYHSYFRISKIIDHV